MDATSLNLLDKPKLLWKKVTINPITSCWEWTGFKDKCGYGRYGFYRELVHRFVYKLYYKEIPKGLCICHKCDNRACVNPSHLFLGTHTDNMRDMINKGRDYHPGMQGSNHWNFGRRKKVVI